MNMNRRTLMKLFLSLAASPLLFAGCQPERRGKFVYDDVSPSTRASDREEAEGRAETLAADAKKFRQEAAPSSHYELCVTGPSTGNPRLLVMSDLPNPPEIKPACERRADQVARDVKGRILPLIQKPPQVQSSILEDTWQVASRAGLWCHDPSTGLRIGSSTVTVLSDLGQYSSFFKGIPENLDVILKKLPPFPQGQAPDSITLVYLPSKTPISPAEKLQYESRFERVFRAWGIRKTRFTEFGLGPTL